RPKDSITKGQIAGPQSETSGRSSGEVRRPVPSAGRSAPSTPSAVPAASEVLDREGVLSRVGGNLKLLRELTEVFGRDTSSLTAQIGAALERHDLDKAARPAHTLKGVVGFFATPDVAQTSKELERMSKSGDIAGANAALVNLTNAIQTIQASLNEM